MAEGELHVLALQAHDHWSASFAHSPEMGFGGKTPRKAEQRLLHATAGIDLDEQHLVETCAMQTDGRLGLVVRVS